ncbi:MAG: RluA family pseudouridine synthase [Chloroflexia bacterium]|nr:RluA family pseudouridine synthase [Chloroflexia bacterium]
MAATKIDVDDEIRVTTLHPLRTDLGARLDRFVADNLTDLSRGTVQSLIASGHVLVDGVQRKPKFHMTPGEVVTVTVPPLLPDTIEPDPIALDIIYEDDDVIVINKPAGLVVHPAPGHRRGTLVNALVAHVQTIAVGGTNRPGIVHRLDKDTSGLIVVAKTDRGRTSLVTQWTDQAVEKTYLALVSGVVAENEATVDAPIGRDPKFRLRMAVVGSGRPAVTHFRVLERFANVTLLEVNIETGRTHQIRVHLAFVGHPVVGDSLYGRASATDPPTERQFLHARDLGFTLPDGIPKRFSAPLSSDLQRILHGLRSVDSVHG